jgi:molybdate transport system substrate-binding protein
MLTSKSGARGTHARAASFVFGLALLSACGTTAAQQSAAGPESYDRGAQGQISAGSFSLDYDTAQHMGRLTTGPVATASATAAPEVKLLSAGGLKPGVDGLVAEFEKSSGSKLTVAYGTAGAVVDRFQKGEAADVVIASGAQIDELQKQGKVVQGSRVNIAKVGIGIFVRKGSAKPDLTSVEDFTRLLSAAKTIVYVDPAKGAASGIYMASLLDRLGTAAAMQPKTKLFPSPDAPMYESVASGEADLGFSLVTEILAQPGVELAGPLPSAIQNYTQFAAGISAGSTQPDAGKALVTFLSSPAAQAVLRTKGFE